MEDGRVGGSRDWLQSSCDRHQSIDVLDACGPGEFERAERGLMRARFDCAREQIDRATERSPAPPDLHAKSPRPPDDEQWPPSARWPEVTPELTIGGIEDGGCLWAQNLLGPDLVAELVDGIDRAFAGYDALEAGGEPSLERPGDGPQPEPWFWLFVPEPAPMHATRPWLRAGGGLYTGDSPRPRASRSTRCARAGCSGASHRSSESVRSRRSTRRRSAGSQRVTGSSGTRTGRSSDRTAARSTCGWR